jgi:hypothetical protein
MSRRRYFSPAVRRQITLIDTADLVTVPPPVDPHFLSRLSSPRRQWRLHQCQMGG